MNPLLIAATEEGSGKTAIALALGSIAKDRSHTVGYMKPKGTHLGSRAGKALDEDPLFARKLLELPDEIRDLEPIVYSETFAKQSIRTYNDVDELHRTVRESYEDLASDRDLMFLEGGSRFTVGGIIRLTDPDIADLLDARVVLVAPYTSVFDLDEVVGPVDQFNDRLVGVLFNIVGDVHFDHVVNDVVPYLRTRNVPVLGVLPHTKVMAGVTITDLAEELGADMLTHDATRDAFVERFLVGAMGSETALHYFRMTKDAAIITGGDRSDLQTTALRASGIKCLILTGGYRPSSMVIGQAEQRNIPILLVSTDTRTTIDRVGSMIPGRTRDERTVNRTRTLLEEYADLETILGVDSDEKVDK